MSKPASQPDPARPPGVEERAQAIVEDVISRRHAGEHVPDEQVLLDHPELLGVLERLLKKAAIVQQMRATARQGPQAIEKLLESLDLDEPSSLAGAAQPALREVAMQLPSTAHSSEAPAEAEGGDECEPGRITIDDLASLEPSADATPRPMDRVSPAAPFRPESRPPMALLKVYDDNQLSGEVVRLRASDLVIGRHAGDVRVRHDSRMSGEHARIERRHGDRGWTWTLRDLGSTNGVFIKASRVLLRDGDQLLIANRTVRFVDPRAVDRLPRLEEVRSDAPGEALALDPRKLGKRLLLGRDPAACVRFLSSEPTLDARFARLELGDQGRWALLADKSQNGLWVRVEQVALVDGAMFQLGEQRFSFHSA